MRQLLILGAMAVVACVPTGGNDPGSGTGTIGVSAHIAATPKLPDTQRAADFDVTFEVSLTDADDRPIDSGSVSFTSFSGRTDLTFENLAWFGSAAIYDQTYTLDVVAAEGSVSGVMVDGPDIHHITSPINGSVFPLQSPLTVSWDRNEPAQEVEITSTSFMETADHDDGTIAVDLSVGTCSIEVSRANRVAPRGAMEGSMMEVRLDNWVDVMVH